MAGVAPVLAELAGAVDALGVSDVLRKPWVYGVLREPRIYGILCELWEYEDQEEGDERLDLLVVRTALLAVIKDPSHAARVCESIAAHVRDQDDPQSCWWFVREVLDRLAGGASNEFRRRTADARHERFGDAPRRVWPAALRNWEAARPATPPIHCHPNPTPMRSPADARERLAVADGFEADCRTVGDELTRLRDEAMRRAGTREIDALYQPERLRSLIRHTPPLPEWEDLVAFDLIWAGEFYDHPRKAEALRKVAAFVGVPAVEVDTILSAVGVAYDAIAAGPACELFPTIQDAIDGAYGAAGRYKELHDQISGGLDRMEWEAAGHPSPAGESALAGESAQARHSKDFRSVHWYGTDYSFTRPQASCVSDLWAAWKNGTPDVGDKTLLAECGANCDRLRDVFKDNPAWNSMIVEGETKSAHRLAAPVA
jgi:hypothetical protein